MSVVEITNIKKNFGEIQVLKGFDLSLKKGEVMGLFGHNGAGKTTTMKLILGLTKPTSGCVKVFGQQPSERDFNHFRYQLGFLPENVSFYQQLTGMEVLRFFAKLKKVPRARCVELLKEIGLYEASSRKVKTYSKGMRQRLGLAQALLTEPSILLLDEPTVGLDPIATQSFYELVDELKSKGCSIILCSHVLAGIEKHIDKAAILSKGQLCAYGSIEELREQTKLTTKLTFNGCFEIDDLAKQLDTNVKQDDNGSFSIDSLPEQKMSLIKTLMAQPGITDIDTEPASLEQLYRFYMEREHQIVEFPASQEQGLKSNQGIQS